MGHLRRPRVWRKSGHDQTRQRYVHKWTVHTRAAKLAASSICLALSSGTLAIEYTWDTQCRSHDAEGAFLICGTLYVIYNTRYGGRSTIQCLHDIHDTMHRFDERTLNQCLNRYSHCFSAVQHWFENVSFPSICSEDSPVLFFPKRYTSHSSINYHPGGKQLYAWDDGYQTVYKVETMKNDQLTAQWRPVSAAFALIILRNTQHRL